MQNPCGRALLGLLTLCALGVGVVGCSHQAAAPPPGMHETPPNTPKVSDAARKQFYYQKKHASD